MKRHLLRALAPVLVLCPGMVVAEDEALANERPPMRLTELEAHWGVDCSRLAAELAAWGGQPARPAEPGWPREIELCAAIHNPPGEPAAASCPDFARAARLLAARPDAGAAIRELVLCAP